MTFTRHSALAALLAATLAASFNASAATPADRPDAALAAPDRPDGAGGPDGHDGRGPHDGPRDDFGPPGPGAPGPGMPFGPLRGVKLSEAQQDQLFSIRHAQAPQRREQEKALRKAEQALHELKRAERFDDARAVALTRELGQAVAAEALLRARTDAKVLALLTPEQREQLRQRRQRGPGRGDGPDGDAGAGERRPAAPDSK